MKLFEFVTGSKKICRGCHKAFSVEPLTCPNCGTKVKTHKAEKWGAVIGAFVGFIVWIWREYASFTASSGSKIIDGIAKSVVDDTLRPVFEEQVEKWGFAETLKLYSIMGVLGFMGKIIIGTFAGFIIALLTKKIVLAIKVKKANSNDKLQG